MKVKYVINKDILTGSVLLLFSLIFLIEVMSWPDYSYMRVVGPEVFPTLILSLIGLFSTKIIYDGIKQVKTSNIEDAKTNITANKYHNIYPLLLMTFIVILYALSLRVLGFLLGTFISIFLMMSVLRVKGTINKLIITTGIVLFAYAIFIYALNIPLPKGTMWR